MKKIAILSCVAISLLSCGGSTDRQMETSQETMMSTGTDTPNALTDRPVDTMSINNMDTTNRTGDSMR